MSSVSPKYMYVPIDEYMRHAILYDNVRQSQIAIGYLIDSDNLKMEQQYRNVLVHVFVYLPNGVE